MSGRLRGKGNYSFDDLMDYCGILKNTWVKLESLLKRNYQLNKLIIKDSKVEGWGVNYRDGNKSLCCVHPEKDALVIVFHIREEKIEEMN